MIAWSEHDMEAERRRIAGVSTADLRRAADQVWPDELRDYESERRRKRLSREQPLQRFILRALLNLVRKIMYGSE